MAGFHANTSDGNVPGVRVDDAADRVYYTMAKDGVTVDLYAISCATGKKAPVVISGPNAALLGLVIDGSGFLVE